MNSLTKKSVVNNIKEQLNRNYVPLTDSTYYPSVVLYRSGQTIYLRCAGYTKKEVPANTELTIGNIELEQYYPGADLFFYPIVANNGMIIEVRVKSNGTVTFVSPQKININTPINLHVMYMTGKSNF